MNEIKTELEVFQHDKLYNCRVYLDGEGMKDLTYVCIRCDKIKITYNTSKKRFVVRFNNGGIRTAECDVDKIYLYDLQEDNNVQLPDIDAEWPYDDIVIDMAETK